MVPGFDCLLGLVGCLNISGAQERMLCSGNASLIIVYLEKLESGVDLDRHTGWHA